MNFRSSQFVRSAVLTMTSRSRTFAVVCVFFLGLSFHAFGQEATILGTATDASGSVIPNVNVTLTHTETGESRSTVTNSAGQYVAPDLPIGRYNVSAKAAGFSVAETNDVILNV